MFPPRCSQPPCRNIETNIVMTFGSSAPGRFQKRAGTKATLNSAGSSCGPSETSQKNINTLTTMRTMLTTGVVRRGL